MAIDLATFIQFTDAVAGTWISFTEWLWTLQPMLLLGIGFATGRLLRVETVSGFLTIGLKGVYLAIGIAVLAWLALPFLSGSPEVPWNLWG